jgi:hypothetical protein
MNFPFIHFVAYAKRDHVGSPNLQMEVFILYTRCRQPTARVPSMARGKIFSGTLIELVCSNYDHIKM